MEFAHGAVPTLCKKAASIWPPGRLSAGLGAAKHMTVANLRDLQRQARARLPAPIYHYLEGGADDEWTLRRNTVAFDEYVLMPRCLVNVARIDLTTQVLGVKLDMPLVLSPTGMSQLFHHERELAVARAATQARVLYCLSTLATTKLEDIAALRGGPRMFQVYIFRDRGLTRELIARCREAGYDALCLTVDTPLAGNRERDQRTGMSMPPRFGLRGWLGFAARPRWSMNYLRHAGFQLANIANQIGGLRAGPVGVIEFVNQQFDRTVSWDDAAWLVREWAGPTAIKGLLNADDAKLAVSIGTRALILSNHGGRQLDGVPAPIDCIAPIRDAVGSSIELIVDGGVRRGTHIIKALALGATACAIGRPYLYGLAADGERGVAKALDLLKLELERDLALLGCTSLRELGLEFVRELRTVSRIRGSRS